MILFISYRFEILHFSHIPPIYKVNLKLFLSYTIVIKTSFIIYNTIETMIIIIFRYVNDLYFVTNRQRIIRRRWNFRTHNKLKYIFFTNKQYALRGYEKIPKRYSRRGRFGTNNEYLEKRYTTLNSVYVFLF